MQVLAKFWDCSVQTGPNSCLRGVYGQVVLPGLPHPEKGVGRGRSRLRCAACVPGTPYRVLTYIISVTYEDVRGGNCYFLLQKRETFINLKVMFTLFI